MINWKVRFKNPLFIAQLFLSFFLPLLGYYGLTAQELTTWGSVFSLLSNAFSNPYVFVLIIVSLWHAINDPTTKGIKDSEQAKRYQWPK
ncbi:phage holin [Cytobacillus gottheilii]|uniref:Phage holin n=1 Tax=Cytobacillus gottheilii TaxID=859144 RepID=A0ABX8F926_9BACI|nr:phage holin [Cytobacillus gottheilii]QVY60918.1 phage holin [Cytobacillus gottheilii]